MNKYTYKLGKTIMGMPEYILDAIYHVNQSFYNVP